LNFFKKNIETKGAEKDATKKENFNADEVLKNAGEFNFFIEKGNLSKLLPPIFLIVFVTIIYISLSHFHIKSLKEKEELKSQLNELRSEYISIKSSLMKQSNQSEVAKRLESEGIKELRTPPSIIEVKKQK
jgi:hypothetical protein